LARLVQVLHRAGIVGQVEAWRRSWNKRHFIFDANDPKILRIVSFYSLTRTMSTRPRKMKCQIRTRTHITGTLYQRLRRSGNFLQVRNIIIM
jgi:hypothetical protein